MAAPVLLRGDFDGLRLRALARSEKVGSVTRRLLSLVEIYDGGTRGDAARLGGVGLQTIRDWVLRFNADGPDGPIDGKSTGQPSKLNDEQRRALVAMVEAGPIPAIHGVVRWRLIDLAQWIFADYGISVSLGRPYVFWCSGRRASGRSLDLQTPFFSPRSMLMGSNDGGIDDQIFEVRIIGHRLEHPIPDALDAPPAEAPEHAIPVAKHLRKITPWRARAHDPKHALHEHPVVAPGGAFLVRPTYNQGRHPLPSHVAQNQTIHHTQGRLPKSSLESDLLIKGNP